MAYSMIAMSAEMAKMTVKMRSCCDIACYPRNT